MTRRHLWSWLQPSTARRVRAAIALVVAACCVAVAPPAIPSVAAASDRLPDLQMARLTDFHIETVNGRRLLRFTAIMLNRGAGALELVSSRADVDSPWDIDQVIYDDAAGSRTIQTSATMNYAGDGHSHWHVSRVVDHDMWSSERTVHGSKVGFCFFDTTHLNPELPNSPATNYYLESYCGGLAALSSRVGISVGWGDRYSWQLPFQWIDITGLPGGTYTLRAFVDARDELAESSNSNNCTYTRLSFATTGTAVTLVGSGYTCPNDWTASAFANDIAWLYTAGLTKGCGIKLFCPAAPVTRAEMASFLVRALDLPPSQTDAFTDDDGTTHEPDINALAASGGTSGCGPAVFCPAAPVSRAEMASFLVRAMELPSSQLDAFTDDDGSVHEADIDALAASGITAGCGPRLFCPSNPVSRGQMAAFLHRAFG
jgi:hypothetical protein